MYITFNIAFVCLRFFVPLEHFSLIWYNRWMAANFDLYSALMAYEQYNVILNMPQLLWHRSSVYDAHLRGPVTLTPVAQRLAVERLLT